MENQKAADKRRHEVFTNSSVSGSPESQTWHLSTQHGLSCSRSQNHVSAPLQSSSRPPRARQSWATAGLCRAGQSQGHRHGRSLGTQVCRGWLSPPWVSAGTDPWGAPPVPCSSWEHSPAHPAPGQPLAPPSPAPQALCPLPEPGIPGARHSRSPALPEQCWRGMTPGMRVPGLSPRPRVLMPAHPCPHSHTHRAQLC